MTIEPREGASFCVHGINYPHCYLCKDLRRFYKIKPETSEQREAVESQPHNLLLEDEDRPLIYQCKFCGAPSAKDPSEQDMPVDYCWPEDHQ